MSDTLKSYINFVICPSLLVSGLGTIFLLLFYQKHIKLSGLVLVAFSDAIMTLLPGMVVLTSMFRTVNVCSSTDILLKHSMVFLPFTNGLVSPMTWNYQCWNKIKKDKKTDTRHKENIMVLSVLPQYLLSCLFLLYLLMLTPQKYITRNSESKSMCLPSSKLSYNFMEKCNDNTGNQLNDTNYVFSNFLRDLNKSKTDLIFPNNKINLINNTAEIVQKIYQLVKEEIISNQGNDVAKRVPRTTHKQSRDNFSPVHFKIFGELGATKTSNAEGVEPTYISNRKNDSLPENDNIFELDTEKGDSLIIPPLHSQFADKTSHNFSNKNLPNFVYRRLNDLILNSVGLKENSLDKIHLKVNQPDAFNVTYEELFLNTTDKTFINNTDSIPIVWQNNTRFHVGLSINKGGMNNKSAIVYSKPDENEFKCCVECFIPNYDEKVYLMLVLLVCYLIPTCGAVILYNKAAMEALLDTDQTNAHRNETLLKSARWGMVIPQVILSPGFFSLFMDSMLCTTTPGWLPLILLTATQIHPLFKNIFNLLIMKRCGNLKKKCSKVHPILEDRSIEELETSQVVFPKTQASENKDSKS